jgi:hypothetical protein
MSDKRCLIPVTELLAIGSDRDTWMVMKRTKTLDKDTKEPVGGYSNWVSYKYPVSFEACAAYIEGELIRTSGATSLKELNRTAERLHAMTLETLAAGKLP